MASTEKETLSLYQQIQQIAQDTLTIREKETDELLKQGKILKQAQTLSTKELDKQTESTDKFSSSLRNAAKEAVDLEEKTNSSLVGVSAAMTKLGKASSYASGTITRFKGILGGFSGIVKGTAGFLTQVA
jgi:phage host-nuclease inhibitor protein Gam